MNKIPKDRQIVITHEMGTHVAIWSEVDKKFVYANVQIDLFQWEWSMYYFENEFIEEKEILEWREL